MEEDKEQTRKKLQRTEEQWVNNREEIERKIGMKIGRR